jgi:hypothetical protein
LTPKLSLVGEVKEIEGESEGREEGEAEAVERKIWRIR